MICLVLDKARPLVYWVNKGARENYFNINNFQGEKENKSLEQAIKDFCSLLYNYFS